MDAMGDAVVLPSLHKQSHAIRDLTCRCKDALEELCAAKGLGSIDIAAFTDIKEPVEDLVKREIEYEQWFNPLLSSLKPAEEKPAPSNPVGKHSNGGALSLFRFTCTDGHCCFKEFEIHLKPSADMVPTI